MKFYQYLLCFVGCSFLFFYKGVFAQFDPERGGIPLTNFTPKDYNGTPQIWDIVQDQRGVMYFANNEGILEYDGNTWRKIELNELSMVRSLAMDEKGRIYVGAQNEFGYLIPTRKGELKYVSLIDQVDSTQRDFDFISNIFCLNQKIYFRSYHFLFCWDGERITSIPSKTRFRNVFLGNSRAIIYHDSIGFQEIRGDSLVLLKGSELISDQINAGMILPSNEVILFVREKGLVTWKEGSKNFPGYIKNSEFNNFVKTIQDACILPIGNSHIAMGTWGSGLMILDYNGNVVDLIDKTDGLQDNIIKNIFFDQTSNIWLGCENGITKLEPFSPLSSISGSVMKTNIGVVESICRFNGKIFLAHSLGISFIKSYQTPLHQKTLESLKGIGQSWDIISFKQNGKELLIAALNDSLIQINTDFSYQTIIKECLPNFLLQSKKDANRIYIMQEEGISSIYRNSNKWIDEGMFSDIQGAYRNAVEDSSGNLWCGTIGNGLLHIKNIKFINNKLVNHEAVFYDDSRGLPKDQPIFVGLIDQTVVAGTDRGLFCFDPNRNIFVKDTRIDPMINSTETAIHRLKYQNDSIVWAVTFTEKGEKMGIGYLKRSKENTWEWISTPFNTISEGIVHSLYHDPEGVTWLGGTEGIYRYDSRVSKNYHKDFTSLIRSVITGEDTTLFLGTYFNNNGFTSVNQPDVLKPVLPYSDNSITILYAAQNTEVGSPLVFSYYLENWEKGWSDWSNVTQRDYPNLREGKYIFRVKAKNIYDQESQEAVFEFSVLPPWYRTWWAYVVYVLGLTGFIYMVVKLYTRNLRAIIKERTAEIRHQKEIVEEKNTHILDSIKYAKRIQDALIVPKDVAAEALPDHFILFKPRDIVSGDFYWMKQKNNTIVTVAADCTGHGVPGAFVSMLGIAFLNEIVSKTEELSADQILNQMREHVVTSLRQTGKEGESKDGMDIALCIINKDTMKLQYAGANNPLILVRGQELTAIKANHMPIGYYLVMDSFDNHEMDIMPGDMLYTFSDGYEDQFGGTDSSKFKIKRMKELLVSIAQKPLEEQKQILDDTIEEWKGTNDQVDDILVIGVRV